VIGDRAFNALLGLGAAVVLGMVVLIGYTLARGAAPAVAEFGPQFVVSTDWDPVHHSYGALPFIYGTLASTFWAVLIAVPVGLLTAIFLAEIAPGWLAQPIGFTVELLAAIPSVVLGLWGIFVLVPLVRAFELFVADRGWGEFPLFRGPPMGIGMLAAALILAIMILPFITSIARDAIAAVPQAQSDAALALGATHWESIRGPVLKYARKGILGGIVLAVGRALGETMAVTMVIGNNPQISLSLFESAYTMSALLANQFAEATEELHVASLIEIALILLVLTVVVNGLARLMIWGTARGDGGHAT
jgi:phosphate transport system permease protein